MALEDEFAKRHPTCPKCGIFTRFRVITCSNGTLQGRVECQDKACGWWTNVPKLKNEGRQQSRLRKWRFGVLERDGYKCVECGSTEDIEAHHVKPKALFPELAYDVSNGITLCRACHDKRHPWRVQYRRREA